MSAGYAGYSRYASRQHCFPTPLGNPRLDEMYNASSELWLYPGVFSQSDVSGRKAPRRRQMPERAGPASTKKH